MAERREDIKIRVEGEDDASVELRRVADATEQLGDESARAERKVRELADEMDRSQGAADQFGAVLGKAKAAVGAFLALEAVGAIKEFALETINATAATGDFADSLGISVEQLTALEAAFANAGTDSETFRSGLEGLAAKLGEVRDGGEEAIALFKRYGVAADDAAVTSGNVDQVLVKLADGFRKSGDANKKYIDSLALFGDAGKSMVGPLNEGSAALERMTQAAIANGDALSSEQVAAAKEAAEAIGKLGREFKQFGSDIVLLIAPALTSAVGHINELTQKVKEFFAELNGHDGQKAADALVPPDVLERLTALRERAATLKEEIEELSVAQNRRNSLSKETIAFLERETGGSQRLRDSIRDVSVELEQSKVGYAAVIQEIEALEAAHRSVADTTTGTLDALRALYQQLEAGDISYEQYRERVAALNEQQESFIRAVKGQREVLVESGDALSRYRADIEAVIELYQQGKISADTLNDSLASLVRTREQDGEKLRKLQELELERVKALGDLYEQQNQTFTSATERRIEEIQKAIAATDDEIEQGKLVVQLAETQAAAARQKAKANDEEAVSLDQKVEALRREIQAGGENVEEKQKELLATQQLAQEKREEAEESRQVAEAKEAEAEAARNAAAAREAEANATAAVAREQARATERAEQMAAATDFVNTQLGNAVGYLKQFSDAAVREFTAYLTGSRAATASTDALTDALRDTEERLVRTEQAFGRADGFARWANRITAASLEIGQQFLNQAIRAREFVADIDRLTESSTELTARQLTQLRTLANANVDAFNLLDDARLDALNAAIGRASDKLRELQDEAKEAKAQLAGIGDQLRDELDRLRGDETAIEQRRYEQQLRNIEELSKLGGDAARAEAAAAERLAEQIHQANLRRIREEREQRALGSERPSGGGGTGASTRAGSGGGGGGITVNFPNAKLIDRDFWEHEALPQLNRIAKLRTQKNLI